MSGNDTSLLGRLISLESRFSELSFNQSQVTTLQNQITQLQTANTQLEAKNADLEAKHDELNSTLQAKIDEQAELIRELNNSLSNIGTGGNTASSSSATRM